MCVCVCVCVFVFVCLFLCVFREVIKLCRIRITNNSSSVNEYIHVCIIIYEHSYVHEYICQRHHAVLLAWISLTLSRHPFLLYRGHRRSSRLQPVSAQSCGI